MKHNAVYTFFMKIRELTDDLIVCQRIIEKPERDRRKFPVWCFYLFDEKGVSWHPSNIDNIEVIDNYYDNQELVEV
jgi:hypothetical protein